MAGQGHRSPLTQPRLLRLVPTKAARGAILFFVTLLLLLALLRMHSAPPYDAVNATAPTSRYAIATFLTENTYGDDDQDGYFVATRIMTYQLLHANETRIRDHNRHRVDWLVMVTVAVTQESRQRLEKDGATVVPVAKLPVPWWVRTFVTRWKDQFTKLRLLQMTQYARVLFLDADTLLTGPVDGIFEDEFSSRQSAPTILDRRRRDEMPYPVEYVFLAQQDNALRGKRDHAVPPDPRTRTDSLSAGFWLAAPSHQLFRLLLRITTLYRRFDPTTMEQSMMNYAFRRDGPMPWRELNWRWSATWPTDRDRVAGVHSLHEKFWRTGPAELVALWESWKERMEQNMGH